MRRVVLETPYSGDVQKNIEYARRCLLDCLRRGEAPLASHLLHTQVLDDSIPEERALGVAAGHEWIVVADAIVVYIDNGISEGMKAGIKRAEWLGLPIEHRRLS